MYPELRKCFKYLDLVREDIREELDLLGGSTGLKRICDSGCGNGLTTFALALEMENADCFGIDLFESVADLNQLHHHIKGIQKICQESQSPESLLIGDLCTLYQEGRLPKFSKGNIVLNQGIPENIDLAYCKKLLINIRDKRYRNNPSGEKALLMALNNISESLSPGGKICAIEYDREFKLEKYFNECRLPVMKRTQFQRNEIRTRGRTNVVSNFTLYLCQKQE
jgi:SAM-dependent methyltransferase